VRTFFGQGGGYFRSGRPHFLVQKTSNFSKFIVYSHGQGRGWAMRTFCGLCIFSEFKLDLPQAILLLTQPLFSKT